MGPSGSGKTSLLSILGGRTPKGATIASGEGGGVLFNGEPLTKGAKRQLGFVLQDDLLYESLTVHETLYFAAMLRLPKTMTPAQKRDRVDSVISALGLSKCRDTIIGGFFRRGVSGGERKRVSVGHELLINPSVLLLDEPTSGLDSTTAMRLVTTLRSLAAGGRAVATTIHQPSSRLFQLLDKLLLLSEGHAIYYGRAPLAADWFARLGYRMPYGVNAADFLLDVASGDVVASSGGGDGEGGDEGGAAKKGTPSPSASPPPLSGEASRLFLIDAYERFAALHGHRHDGFAASVDIGGPESDGSQGYEAMMKAAADARRRSLSASLSGNDAGGGGGGPLAVGTMEAVDLDGSSRSLRPGGSAAAAAAAAAGNGGGAGGAANGGAANGATALSSIAKVKAARTSAASLPGGGAAGGAGAGKERRSDRWGASYWTQISVLFSRAVKTRRFEALSLQDFLQFIIVGVLSGLFWWQIGRNKTVAAAANANGLLFFEMLFLSFRSMFAALFTFPSEYKMMLKERASGMYRLSAFYFARSASDIPMEVTVPSVFIVIVYFMAGLRLEAWAFFANWASVTLVLLVAQSFGLLIGELVVFLLFFWGGGRGEEKAERGTFSVSFLSLLSFLSLFSLSLPSLSSLFSLSLFSLSLSLSLSFLSLSSPFRPTHSSLPLQNSPPLSPLSHLSLVSPSQKKGATVMVPKTAQTITSVIMLTMMLVGGFYVTNIPAWIAWMKYLSFVYYGYNLLLKVEYSGVTLFSCRGPAASDGSPAGGAAGVVVRNPEADPSCSPVPPGGLQAILHLQENTETWPWEAIALLGWLVVFRYAIYWALRRKTSSTARK